MARIKKVNHIGVAVKDGAKAARFYADSLGIKVDHEEVVESQGVKVFFVPVGESTIELLEATGPESPIAKYLEKNREGIHHICFEVEGIDEMLKDLAAQGAVIGSGEPTQGAHGMRVGFLHPKATGGVLIELAEKGHDA